MTKTEAHGAWSGAEPVGMLRERHDATSEHEHADGPQQQGGIIFIGHGQPRGNHCAKLGQPRPESITAAMRR